MGQFMGQTGPVTHTHVINHLRYNDTMNNKHTKHYTHLQCQIDESLLMIDKQTITDI